MRVTIVHKNRHRKPPHLLSHQWHEVEVCRRKEVFEAKVILVSSFDNRADTVWKVPPRDRLVSIGLLPNVNSQKNESGCKADARTWPTPLDLCRCISSILAHLVFQLTSHDDSKPHRTLVHSPSQKRPSLGWARFYFARPCTACSSRIHQQLDVAWLFPNPTGFSKHHDPLKFFIRERQAMRIATTTGTRMVFVSFFFGHWRAGCPTSLQLWQAPLFLVSPLGLERCPWLSCLSCFSCLCHFLCFFLVWYPQSFAKCLFFDHTWQTSPFASTLRPSGDGPNHEAAICKQYTSHVTASTCNDLSHDIGSSVCARHPIHVSCAWVIVCPLSDPNFTLFICLSHLLFHPPELWLLLPFPLPCGCPRSKILVHFAQWGVWPFGQ